MVEAKVEKVEDKEKEGEEEEESIGEHVLQLFAKWIKERQQGGKKKIMAEVE